MALITFNPTTPSNRNTILVNKRSLWSGNPVKTLTTANHGRRARNSSGRITVQGRSRGVKKKYRIIDFKRNSEMECVVERIEHDPNRSSHIALVRYKNKSISYIIAPDKLSVGDTLTSSSTAEIKIGNCLALGNIPTGTIVHNIEMKAGKGGQIARSAGSFATIINKDDDKVHIRMRSGEVRYVESSCKATIGIVSNLDNKNIKYGKAGRKRWLGFNPKVRGVAKNPVDHPHGGGEGKTSGGRHPVNKNGKLAKGFRTRNNKRTDKYILRSRHKKK